MLELIEKQQVRKRATRLTVGSPHNPPTVVERPRSVAGQRWLAKREPLAEQVMAPKPRLALQSTEQQPVSRPRTKTKTKNGPVVAALAAAATVAVVIGVVIATYAAKPKQPPLPTKAVSLPGDHQIAAILAKFSASTAPAAPQVPVKFPNTTILKTLKSSSYTIQSGDTISAVAQKTGVSVETLISFNGITDVRSLTKGTVLKVPSMNGILYRVQKGDTLGGIAKAHEVKLADILDVNAITTPVIIPGQELFLPGAHMNSFALRKALGTLFVWPTKGTITSPFGMRHDPFTGIVEFHNGIDIANALGTPIDAAMDGSVALVGTNRGYGNFIILNNGNGFQTLYGHLSKSLVKKGQYVRAGQRIALMGDTGYATGPHLHFTIYKNSAPVNPLKYLEKR